jgi:toxin ParE1/3/4
MARAPARFETMLTEGAGRDLGSLYDHIAEFDCLANAHRVLDRLLGA